MSLKQALLSNYYKRKSGNVNESESSSDDESVYLPSKSKVCMINRCHGLVLRISS